MKSGSSLGAAGGLLLIFKRSLIFKEQKMNLLGKFQGIFPFILPLTKRKYFPLCILCGVVYTVLYVTTLMTLSI